MDNTIFGIDISKGISKEKYVTFEEEDTYIIQRNKSGKMDVTQSIDSKQSVIKQELDLHMRLQENNMNERESIEIVNDKIINHKQLGEW